MDKVKFRAVADEQKQVYEKERHMGGLYNP
jgi:hypothetical protein